MGTTHKPQKAPQSEPQRPSAEEYRPPSYAALARLGFEKEACLPAIDYTSFPGKQGSTNGIQIYPGYKGSPKIEIVMLSHGWFTMGPPGPNKEPNPKYRVRNGYEFEAALLAAGYPTKEDKKRLDKEDEDKQIERWESACAFAKLLNKPLPPKPKFK